MTDTGLIRSLYVAPSYKLTADNRLNYNSNTQVLECLLNETSNVFHSNVVNTDYNTLIVDEASQIRNCDMMRLIELYPNHKIIVCGDIGYQTAPIETGNGPNQGDIEHKLFNNVVSLNTNYRIKDPNDKLHEILKSLRQNIDEKRPFKLFSIRFLFNETNTIFLNDLKNYYEPTDLIITGTHNAIKEINNLLISLVPNKYLVSTKTKDYNRGEILLNLDPTKDFKGDISHAFTIHSVQGETTEHNLFIDLRGKNKNYDYRLLYTALSRSRTSDKIFYIIDDPNETQACEDLEGDFDDGDFNDGDEDLYKTYAEQNK
jgi:hypothetical protein